MWTLIAACVLNIALPEVELRTVGGDSARGTLVELDARHLVVQTPEGRSTWELEKLAGITVGSPADPNVSAAVSVELVDGSKLAAEAFTAEKGRARVKLSGGDAIELSGEDVRSVRFVQPTEAVAAQWSRIVASATVSDILVVKKDEAIDYHKGILHRVTDEAVEFDLEGERLPVRRSKVFGLVYHHPSGRDLPEPIGILVDRSGSTWTLRTLVLSGDQIEWTTLAGVKLRRPAAAVARLDFSRGKVFYLSDLKPDSLQWVPYFGLGKELPSRVAWYSPREDRNLQSSPLQIDGKRYAKGLSMHSRTEIVYRLPDRYRIFRAVVGIDDSARPQGNVRLVIHGDDRVLFEAIVTGADPPGPVELDMTGVRRLTILADFGDDFDVGDHLDLCEARLLK
jgi:hypothetical protein